jgi:hypothetical protein
VITKGPRQCRLVFAGSGCYKLPTVSLLRQSEFRAVRSLPFCYLCGRKFGADDSVNRDHVPAECVFAPVDRELLLLPTHTACNKSYELIDEKLGQLIALRYGKAPQNPDHRRLKLAVSPGLDQGAVVSLDIDAAVWRWIAGFHAALYREPGVGVKGSLITPFPKARIVNGRSMLESLRVQRPLFVEAIKYNRRRDNLDRISCNKGKLTYECVWQQADGGGPWMCIFALDVCDWKDLGRTPGVPARGCAGFYLTPAQTIPANATQAMTPSIIIPTGDRLDAFAP